jgi:hypothetical protein
MQNVTFDEVKSAIVFNRLKSLQFMQATAEFHNGKRLFRISDTSRRTPDPRTAGRYVHLGFGIRGSRRLLLVVGDPPVAGGPPAPGGGAPAAAAPAPVAAAARPAVVVPRPPAAVAAPAKAVAVPAAFPWPPAPADASRPAAVQPRLASSTAGAAAAVLPGAGRGGSYLHAASTSSRAAAEAAAAGGDGDEQSARKTIKRPRATEQL